MIKITPIFKWFLSFINFATKGFFYLLVDYLLTYTWLNGEPQISRKERYKDIFPGTYILEYLMIVYFRFQFLVLMYIIIYIINILLYQTDIEYTA